LGAFPVLTSSLYPDSMPNNPLTSHLDGEERVGEATAGVATERAGAARARARAGVATEKARVGAARARAGAARARAGVE